MILPCVDGREFEQNPEYHRDNQGRFAVPQLDIKKMILQFDESADCHYCGAPIFLGDPVYRDDTTFVEACSEEHCTLAAKAKLELHGETPVVRD